MDRNRTDVSQKHYPVWTCSETTPVLDWSYDTKTMMCSQFDLLLNWPTPKEDDTYCTQYPNGTFQNNPTWIDEKTWFPMSPKWHTPKEYDTQTTCTRLTLLPYMYTTSHNTVTRWRLESTYIHTMHTTCTELNSYTWLRQIYLLIQDRLTERSKHLSPSSHLMTLTFATATQRRGRAFVRTTVRQCGDGWDSNFCSRTILTAAITHCRYTNDVTHQ